MAHAEAGSWNAVQRLLAERDWLDVAADGMGRVLLGRAALALGDPASAAEHFADAGVADLSVEDRIEYARALRAIGRLEEAAAQFEQAAEADQELAGWLLLTAVQTWTEAGRPDTAVKVAAALHERPDVWSDSTFAVLAVAYFASGDAERGLSLADSLSRPARARLAGQWILPALLATGDSAGGHREAESALRHPGVGPETGQFLATLDGSPDGLRRIAAVELREGRGDNAVDFLRRARAAAVGEDVAHITLELADALFASRQYADVGRVLDPWIHPAGGSETRVLSLRTESEMRFLAGRALYRRGRRTEATAQWLLVAADPTAPDGPRASWLLADMQHDQNRLTEARAAFEETVVRFPRSAWAGRALVRLGLIDMVEGRPRDAAALFDSYRRRFPGGDWFEASTFWAARAREAAGDSAGARVLYRQVLGENPLGYYGIQSARALGEEAWDHVRWRATPPPRLRPDHTVLVRRMTRLRDLGWKGRALRELSARNRSGETRDERLALAIALNEAGFSWQGTSIGWAVFRARAGLWSEDLLRAVYPLLYDPVLRARAAAENLDPALVAALVRRESQFDRDVVSSAGATGLMQVLPTTGAELARRTGLAEFRPEQLTVPEVNLLLGTRYLRELLERRDGALVPALISYNAGPHRFASWRRFPEFSSSTELMIDRIPFTETRRYVKAILSYRYTYARLYEFGSGSG
jgi:soluble lytic murein transglycosylase